MSLAAAVKKALTLVPQVPRDGSGRTVFVSYTHADRIRAKALVSRLESRGYVVLWDERLAAGDPLRARIRAMLARADRIVVLWSPASVVSEWVHYEASQALKAGKYVPVASADLDLADVPPPFNGRLMLADSATDAIARALDRAD
jgi:hypothetical protein